MKKIILIVIAFSLFPFCIKAMDTQHKITITATAVVRSGDEVQVRFIAQTEKDIVQSNVSYIFAPVITNGEYRISLPAVIIRGKYADKVQTRNQRLFGQSANLRVLRIVQPGMSVDYFASVPFQEWIEGATLIMESRSWGCCNSEIYPDKLLVDEIFPPVPDTIVPEIEVLTVGDKLAQKFSFVIPETGRHETELICDDNRDQSLIVYYPRTQSKIQLDYMDNRMMLDNLITVINTIAKSSDSQVSRIVVGGFSSPEGSFIYNDRLAWERAVAVKEHIINNTDIKDDVIVLHNGSEDWRGLRDLIAASELYDKAEILRIIDTVPLFSANGHQKERLQQLKELNGGISYRYMYEYFFPLLRHSAFIKVYYSNK
ncbi:MAG: DUF3868 domain-containing protein [Bacteroidales bacterium]|nr:DUF3868 domain-containing protein [Bacteroidales bacterium]MCL2133508.1 DUF3868 domain-containing protein [Bacteroidales bacterium]